MHSWIGKLAFIINLQNWFLKMGKSLLFFIQSILICDDYVAAYLLELFNY